MSRKRGGEKKDVEAKVAVECTSFLHIIISLPIPFSYNVTWALLRQPFVRESPCKTKKIKQRSSFLYDTSSLTHSLILHIAKAHPGRLSRSPVTSTHRSRHPHAPMARQWGGIS